MRRIAIAAVLALGGALGPWGEGRAQDLIMFDEVGCIWCDRWTDEVGVVYAKTEEGQRAPLRRVNLHKAWPEDLQGIAPVRFTPTFVLFVQGAEVGRIEGYPGEEFFWGLLSAMLQNLDEETAEGS